MNIDNFVIVGTIRTGSSALAETLSLHPDVVCGWEWTTNVAWRRQINFAKIALSGDFSHLSASNQKHLAEKYNQDIRVLGFRRLFSSSPKWIIHPKFSPALFVERFNHYMRWLAKSRDIKIIHIVRLDALDWLKSVYLARKTGYFISKEYPNDLKVYIPPRDAIKRLRSKKWIDSTISMLRNSNPYIKIEYEEFLKDQKTTISKALKFLSCDESLSNFIDCPISKQSTESAKHYLLNYVELISTIERIKF